PLSPVGRLAAGLWAVAFAGGPITRGGPATISAVVATIGGVAIAIRRRPAWFAKRPHLGPIILSEMAYQLFSVLETYYTLWLVNPARTSIASAIVLETVSRAVTVAFKIVPMRIGVDEASSSFAAGRLHLDPVVGLAVALVRKL